MHLLFRSYFSAARYETNAQLPGNKTVLPRCKIGQVFSGGQAVINVKNELQYILVVELLEKAAAAGFMNDEELAFAKHLAAIKYSPKTVWE